MLKQKENLLKAIRQKCCRIPVRRQVSSPPNWGSVVRYPAILKGLQKDMFGEEICLFVHLTFITFVFFTNMLAGQNTSQQKWFSTSDHTCLPCERIALFEQCKTLCSDRIWPGLGEGAFRVPLLYFTENETFVAFADSTLPWPEGYREIACDDGMLLKKLPKRLLAQPFLMENKMSFGDSASLFFRRPMMLCSDVETMHRFVPDFEKTEDWLQLVMHEYFHSFQFSHPAMLQYLGDTLRMGADTLERIYEANEWFAEAVVAENDYLLRAIKTIDRDSAIFYAKTFLSARENRLEKFRSEYGGNIGDMENFWETMEGTARYVEYYMAAYFGEIILENPLGCDSLFHGFSGYKNIGNLDEIPEFQQRTEVSANYYYATGFNICRLLDKWGIKFKNDLFHHRINSLFSILQANTINK